MVTGLMEHGISAELMPLSLAGCGRLQLGAANLATSVALPTEVVDNYDIKRDSHVRRVLWHL